MSRYRTARSPLRGLSLPPSSSNQDSRPAAQREPKKKKRIASQEPIRPRQSEFLPFKPLRLYGNSFGGQSYGFTGLEHDESGLVYARNRYYSPGLVGSSAKTRLALAAGRTSTPTVETIPLTSPIHWDCIASEHSWRMLATSAMT